MNITVDERRWFHEHPLGGPRSVHPANRTADNLGVRGMILPQQKPHARGGERHREDRDYDEVFHSRLAVLAYET